MSRQDFIEYCRTEESGLSNLNCALERIDVTVGQDGIIQREPAFVDLFTEGFYQGMRHNPKSAKKVNLSQKDLVDGKDYKVTFNKGRDCVVAGYIAEYNVFSHIAGSISLSSAEKIDEI